MNNLTTRVERCFFKLYRRVIGSSARNRATILNFHRVFDGVNIGVGDFISRDEFVLKMEFIKKYFTVLSLPEALECYREKNIPSLAVIITIDDGYQDSYSVITPILESLGIQGAFFIATEGIDNGLLWNDKIRNAIHRTEKLEVKNFLGLPCQEINTLSNKQSAQKSIHNLCKYMTLESRENAIDELIELLDVDVSDDMFLTAANILEMHNAGMTIGAHTHKHPILNLETNENAYLEISQSKDILEGIIETSVDYFAYPNGKYNEDFNQSHILMLKELGFKAGLTTNWGSLHVDSDLYAIPRYTPWDRDVSRFGIRLCHHFRKKADYWR